MDPGHSRPVFSQIGVSRALKVPQTSVRRIIASEAFKRLRGNACPLAKLLTEVNSRPISVVTQVDLVFIVQLAAEAGYPVARSMQDASFAILLQESVDIALGIERPRKEYLQEGASLRQLIEYKHTYHAMKQVTFENGHGVRGLCAINSQVSSLAVSDADKRRKENPAWRKKCDKEETMRLTIGNVIHEKAASASPDSQSLKANLSLAADRSKEIYGILDKPF